MILRTRFGIYDSKDYAAYELVDYEVMPETLRQTGMTSYLLGRPRRATMSNLRLLRDVLDTARRDTGDPPSVPVTPFSLYLGWNLLGAFTNSGDAQVALFRISSNLAEENDDMAVGVVDLREGWAQDGRRISVVLNVGRSSEDAATPVERTRSIELDERANAEPEV